MSDKAVLKGLAAIQAKIAADEAAREASGDFVKAEWFKLKDKEAAVGVFAQEMDPDSPNYSEKRGVGIVAVEHSNPQNFKRKALCTLEEEGRCWACEQHRKDYKAGWKQKSRLYINFLLLDPKGDDHKMVVLSQGLSESQITPALFEQATEFGTITDRKFKIKRSGAGFNDTSYILTALVPHDVNLDDYEVYDLDKIVRHVPYDQQAAHYLDGGTAASEPEPELATVGAGGSASAGSDDEDTW
jgi:hypothetical protein